MIPTSQTLLNLCVYRDWKKYHINGSSISRDLDSCFLFISICYNIICATIKISNYLKCQWTKIP